MRITSLVLVIALVFILLSGCEMYTYSEVIVPQSKPSSVLEESHSTDTSAQPTSPQDNASMETEASNQSPFSEVSESSTLQSEVLSSEPKSVPSQSESSQNQSMASEGDPTKKGIFARRNVLVNHFYDTVSQSSIAYCLVLPRNYDPNNSYPVLLYLHGLGVEGSDGERHVNLLSIMQRNAPHYLDNAILIAPQCPSGKNWGISQNVTDYTGTLATVKRLLDSVAKQYSCDKNRYYAVGYSFGGFGVLSMADHYNELFAAVQIIAGWYDTTRSESFVNLPIWFHHGTSDNVVNPEKSQQLYSAIKKLGSQKAKISLYEGVEHNSYSNAFSDMTTYTWLFTQTK